VDGWSTPVWIAFFTLIQSITFELLRRRGQARMRRLLTCEHCGQKRNI